eukprot:4143295-Amphidinium_carterae.1
MPALEAHMARLQFAKGVWFPERLAKHAGTEPWCLLCGQRGTLPHRVFTCPAFARHRAHFLRQDDLEFYASLSEADAAVWASLHMPAPRPAQCGKGKSKAEGGAEALALLAVVSA